MRAGRPRSRVVFVRAGRPRSRVDGLPTMRWGANAEPPANIPSLAERIHAAFSDSGIAWELLLIDDNSEDGSEAVLLGLYFLALALCQHQLW